MFQLMRQSPWQGAMSLRDAMNQLLTDSFVQFPFATGGERNLVPAVDLSETPDAYVVEASVPGLKAEDLTITFEGNVLSICGEIKRESEKQEQNYHHTERYCGKFQRSLTFPNMVKSDEIKASLQEGVLRLEVPKAEEVKPRQITINVGT
ncbi:MAG: Hsp20/alpha crystallin family protein [Chloroflexaceae bacterium]|nr:Hsp20/alpha crystallin family protein [Chloroflexaceae bacterium]